MTRRIGQGIRPGLRSVPPPAPARRGFGHFLRLAIWLALAVWGVHGLLGNSHGLLRILGLKRDIADLHVQEASLTAQRDSLRGTLKQMKTPEGIERTARESYGFSREGEIQYRIQDADSTSRDSP